jgi:preprotein translocase subunit SecB
LTSRIFERTGESPLTDFEEFGKVNGAAIIFPFIREHIMNMSLKGGIGAVILPPLNFTKIV